MSRRREGAGRRRESPAAAARREAELAGMARALGHPARVAILRLLLDRGGCICGAIVERLPLAQATVSQHLKVLKEAGWIEGTIDGPRVCYCARPQAGERFQALLQEMFPLKERLPRQKSVGFGSSAGDQAARGPAPCGSLDALSQGLCANDSPVSTG